MVALGGQYQGEETSYEPIPPGEYPMHIVASEMAPTKDGRGRYLKLELEICEGPQAGRKLTERLNLENTNAQTVEIAQRTLRSIIFAAGLSSCDDSEQLHLRRMIVKVKVKPGDDKYGPSNEIGGYKPAGGAVQSSRSAPSPTPTPSPAAAQSGGSVPPWKRNAA